MDWLLLAEDTTLTDAEAERHAESEMANDLAGLKRGDYVGTPDYTLSNKDGRIVLLHRRTGWDATRLEAMIAAVNADRDAAHEREANDWAWRLRETKLDQKPRA